MDRRSMIKNTVNAGLTAVTMPMINLGSFQISTTSPKKYSTRAVDLVQRSTVIDMLNPFSLFAVLAGYFGDRSPTWFSDPTLFRERDWQRFQNSGFNILHVAVGTDSYEETLRFLASWNSFIAHHSDWLMRIDSAERLDTVKKSGNSASSLVCRTLTTSSRPET